MENDIRYVHTNIISKNWKELARFYIDTFHCKPIYPERNLFGDWIDQLTRINKVRIKGIHLRLPGYEDGPTLEIFEYSPNCLTDCGPEINRQGLAHLAFHVNSVENTLKNVLDNGGEQLGELAVRDFAEFGTLTVVYTRDPEGNIVEIQNWKK